MLFQFDLSYDRPAVARIALPVFAAKTPPPPKEKPKVTLSQIVKQDAVAPQPSSAETTPEKKTSEPTLNHHPEVVKRREKHGQSQSTKKKGALALLLASLASLGGAIGVQVNAPQYPEGSDSYYRSAPKEARRYSDYRSALERADHLLKNQQNKQTPALPELQKMEEQGHLNQLSLTIQDIWLQLNRSEDKEMVKLNKQVGSSIFNFEESRYSVILRPEFKAAFTKAAQDYSALNISRMGEKPEQEKAIFRALNQELLGKTYSKELVNHYNALADQTLERAQRDYDKFVKDTAENETYFAEYKNAKVKGAEANFHSLWMTMLGLGSAAGAIGLAAVGYKRRRTFHDALQKHLDNTLQQKIYWINHQNVETLTPLEKSLMGFNIENEIKNANTAQARAMIALKDLGITWMGEKPAEELVILETWIKEHFADSPNWESTGRTMDAIEEYYDSLSKTGDYRMPYTRFVIALELFLKTSGLK